MWSEGNRSSMVYASLFCALGGNDAADDGMGGVFEKACAGAEADFGVKRRFPGG